MQGGVSPAPVEKASWQWTPGLPIGEGSAAEMQLLQTKQQGADRHKTLRMFLAGAAGRDDRDGLQRGGRGRRLDVRLARREAAHASGERIVDGGGQQLVVETVIPGDFQLPWDLWTDSTRPWAHRGVCRPACCGARPATARAASGGPMARVLE